MKLPAVAIAAAFATGIALGLHPAVVPHATSRFFLGLCFAAGVVLIVAGLALARMERLFPAATISILSWALLGFLGTCAAEQPRPANHVTSLLEQSRLSLHRNHRCWRSQCLRSSKSRTAGALRSIGCARSPYGSRWRRACADGRTAIGG